MMLLLLKFVALFRNTIHMMCVAISTHTLHVTAVSDVRFPYDPLLRGKEILLQQVY